MMELVAPIPLLKAKPWVPPSRAATFRSSASRVGFFPRAYSSLLSRLRAREPVDRVVDIAVKEVAGAFGLEEVRVRIGDPAPEPAEGPSGWEPSLVVPLRAGDRDVGVLEGRGPAPADEDAALLRAFAGQLALAIERARLDESARRAELDADASQTRAALFGSVTHDLRTPLASIKASVTSLLEEGVAFEEEQRRELLRTILEEADRLNRLVGNLIDLSRIRTGALVPAKVPVEAGSWWTRWYGGCGVSSVNGASTCDCGRTCRRFGSTRCQLDQVLTNLIENAVRFSPPGSPIVISVARWRDGIQVRVSDRGSGIPPDERERVFEAFARGEGSGPGGTGLGLAIARAVVTVHGGRIWLEETPGGGATVVFELPGGAPEAA